MAEFRYLFADLLTRQVTLEVPLYGVSYDRILNKPGNMTFSINLDRTGYSNQDVIDATVPGKTAVYIDRDGSLVWGGIVWSRTYQAQAKVFSYTSQSFESYPYKINIEETLTYTNMDQRNILNALIVHMQQKLQSDISILTDPDYPYANDVVRSVVFNDYDAWTYGKAIDYLIEFDEGFDYTIEVYYDSDGTPAQRVLTDNILGAPLEASGLIFDYPGNIGNYYWPENASRGAISVMGFGAGEGAARITSYSLQNDLLSAGFPNLQEIYSNQDVSIQATLDSQTAAQGKRLRIPITVPTLELDLGKDESTAAGKWQLGDYARLMIEDARFPQGLDTSVRVIGYSATPSTSEDTETMKPVLEGQDDA